MTARTLLRFCLVATVGCGTSHQAPDGGARDDAHTPAADAGPVTRPDADVETRPDAGVETRPDASVPPLASCTGEILSSAGMSCFCQGPFVRSGDLAYRVSYDVEVLEIRSDEVLEVGRVSQRHAGSEGAVALARDHLFVGGWGLEVFDVSTPTAPRSVADIALEGTVTDLFVERATMWIGFDGRDGTSSIRAYDVSDPTAPRELTSFPLEGVPGSVLPHGADRIVVLEARRSGETGPDTAAIIDTSSPSSPALVTRIPLESRAVLRRRGAIDAGLLYVIGSDPALQIIDLASRAVVATLRAPEGRTDSGLGVSVADGLAFIGTGTVDIADVSRPRAPRWIGSVPSSGDPFYSRLADDQLLVSNGNRLDLVALDCR